MAEAVYILCAITSLACAIMLYRSYSEGKARLLFWSALCFLGFALNNAVLCIDSVIGPLMDLSVWRLIPAVFGICALVYGLIREVV